MNFGPCTASAGANYSHRVPRRDGDDDLGRREVAKSASRCANSNRSAIEIAHLEISNRYRGHRENRCGSPEQGGESLGRGREDSAPAVQPLEITDIPFKLSQFVDRLLARALNAVFTSGATSRGDRTRNATEQFYNIIDFVHKFRKLGVLQLRLLN